MKAINPQYLHGNSNPIFKEPFYFGPHSLIATKIQFVANFRLLCKDKKDSYGVRLKRQQFEENQDFKIGKNTFYSNQTISLTIDGSKQDNVCSDKVATRTKWQAFYLYKQVTKKPSSILDELFYLVGIQSKHLYSYFLWD